MQARYYDPVIGRFYSSDPVGTIEHLSTQNGIHGFSRYAYANNNPYRFTDPTGMCSEENSGSELACAAEDYITEVIEPIIEEILEESTDLKVPEAEDRDPDGSFDYTANNNSFIGEISAIIIAGAKAKAGGKGKFKGGNKNKRDQELKGLPKDFKRWFHREWKQKGDRDSSNEEIQIAYDAWVKQGKPKG